VTTSNGVGQSADSVGRPTSIRSWLDPLVGESGPREPRCGSPLRGFPNVFSNLTNRREICRQTLGLASPARARRERQILEHAVHAVSEQAASAMVDEVAPAEVRLLTLA